MRKITYNNIDIATARKVYALLVKHADAPVEGNAEFRFERYVTLPEFYIVEYCFEGALGRGGKFVIDPYLGWYVRCYTEDITPERIEIINNLKPMLAALEKEFKENVVK